MRTKSTQKTAPKSSVMREITSTERLMRRFSVHRENRPSASGSTLANDAASPKPSISTMSSKPPPLSASPKARLSPMASTSTSASAASAPQSSISTRINCTNGSRTGSSSSATCGRWFSLKRSCTRYTRLPSMGLPTTSMAGSPVESNTSNSAHGGAVAKKVSTTRRAATARPKSISIHQSSKSSAKLGLQPVCRSPSMARAAASALEPAA